MGDVYKPLRKSSDHLTIATARMAKIPNPTHAEKNLRRELEIIGYRLDCILVALNPDAESEHGDQD